MRFFISILALPFIIGCERDPVQTSFGPPTTEGAIRVARDKMLAKLDPYSIKATQRVYTVESQEVISSQNPIKALSKEWITEVSEVEDINKERSIVTLKTVTDKFWDEDFIYKIKTAYLLPLTTTTQMMDPLERGQIEITPFLSRLAEQSEIEESNIRGFGYSNLSEQKVVLVPPQLVKNAKNCKGLKNCQIEADQLKYDIVFLLEDGSTQTFNIEWLVSNQVPFFAGLLKDCNTTIAKVQSQRVLVKRCTEVVDFDAVSSSAP